ncbi:hypothetical protein N7516_007470 [Penicillium verrucosum]|uniref:uncharacterized protein n=1 Tax=Penicillium verrucosum TaxID=60171 RepID=UPI0025458681|nr:uncharacterized protein N7516_007470 [Penicillium verrucosum]KAJ5932981.1 hypothetical protein N7516_007470 [Penicillium verrucosum]
MRSGAANTHSTPHKPGKGRSSEEKQTHTRNLVTWPKPYSLSASQQELRSGPLSVSKPRGVGRKAGNASQRSDPGKVSASDDLTLDLCNPCSMSRPFSNLAGWDYTAMTGHSNVDGKCSPAHAR